MRREYNDSDTVIPTGAVFYAPLSAQYLLKDLVSGSSFALNAGATLSWDASELAYKITATTGNAISRLLCQGLSMPFPNSCWAMEYDVKKPNSLFECGLGTYLVHEGSNSNYQNSLPFESSPDNAWHHLYGYVNSAHYRYSEVDGVSNYGASTSYTGNNAYIYAENFTSVHKSKVTIGAGYWLQTGISFWIKNLVIYNIVPR